MNRLTIALGAVIAITAMLAIPNTSTHSAKASSTCGSSVNSHGQTRSFSSTESGSCASNGEATGGAFGQSAGNRGGLTSSCNSVSVSSASHISDLDKHTSTGSVSCSTHKP